MTALDPMTRADQHLPALPLADVLSSRERQVVTLIAQGYSNQEIADELFLSINSVKTYIRSAYRKLGVSRRSQAVIWVLTQALSTTAPATREPAA